MDRIMSKIILLSGLPGSGKTFLAKEMLQELEVEQVTALRINYDELRIEMFGSNWKFNRLDENKMKEAAYLKAGFALSQGAVVIVDNTSLTEGSRAPWIRLGSSHGCPVEVISMKTPLSECIRRDHGRVGSKRVGRAVIERMALWNGMIDLASRPSNFVICDVDGTLSDTSKRQHYVRESPKNWKAFFAEVSQDALIDPIVHLLGLLPYHVIIVSGRGTDIGKETEDWLNNNKISYDHLFMRQGGDHRQDVEVKQEILDQILRVLPKERIAYVLDDRNAVVEMWRRNGLTCLQVANGEF